jgi:dTDP-4-dehydrorhamnose 3,5-epimerase
VIFEATALSGAFVVKPERRIDERGYFARTWCQREFADRGLNPQVVQCSTSYNEKAGTLRGMHWQAVPHAEVKLVRCTRGAIWDVIIDLRSGSPSYLRHLGVELSAENGHALYIPEGFAHGFVTRVGGTEVYYQMSEVHEPGAARGARWNDPVFGISWPVTEPILHPRDASYPDFQPEPAG